MIWRMITLMFQKGKKKIYVPAKKKQKLQVRRGPRTRSHSSVLEEVQPDWKPSSDEEDNSLLKDSGDDGFEQLAFVLPQKRKSRAKKRPLEYGTMRIWSNHTNYYNCICVS